MRAGQGNHYNRAIVSIATAHSQGRVQKRFTDAHFPLRIVSGSFLNITIRQSDPWRANIFRKHLCKSKCMHRVCAG